MAQYFNLVVQCGRDKEEAEQMEEYFRSIVLQFSNGLTTCCDCCIQQDLQGFWWLNAIPLGASYGSTIKGDTYLLTDQKQYNELRNLLYQQLLVAPPFRCAAAGWEVQDSHIFWDGNPIDDDYSFAELDILCEELWNRLQHPSDFVFFKEGYVRKTNFPRLF